MRLLIDACHQHAVLNASKHKNETKRCDECDEEFFPIHNFFPLRFLLSPIKPAHFYRKPTRRCRSKISCKQGARVSRHALTARRPSLLESATRVRAKGQHPRRLLVFSP